MGFFTFRQTATGTTLDAAFEAAREHARHQFGHSGQTGTLADLLDVVQMHERTVDLATAERLAEEIGYGDAATCHAIPLATEPGEPRAWLLFGKAHR